MKRRIELIKAPVPTQAQAPPEPRIDSSADVIARRIITTLKQQAFLLQGMQGTQGARDAVKTMLQELVVAELDLDRTAKSRLNELLGERMRIVAVKLRVRNLGTIDPSEGAVMFRETCARIRIERQLILSLTWLDAVAIDQLVERLGAAVVVFENAAELAMQTGIETRMRVNPQGEWPILVDAAFGLNTTLLGYYLAGEAGKFNTISSIVMRDFLNVEFPEPGAPR
jgi:hypothetical protein